VYAPSFKIAQDSPLPVEEALLKWFKVQLEAVIGIQAGQHVQEFVVREFSDSTSTCLSCPSK
jgi:hypothetical protein